MIKKIITVFSIVVLTTTSGNIDIYAKDYDTKSTIKDTSENISLELNKSIFTSSKEAIIINENSTIDAISATPLAYAKNAPIIALQRNKLDKKTKDYIQQLGIKKITIIGSWSAISNTTERKLLDMDIDVERLYGEDRYETSRILSTKLLEVKKSDEAFLISDASGLENIVSIYSYAAKNNLPIIWAKEKDLSDSKYYLKTNNIKKIYAIGNSDEFTLEVETIRDKGFIKEVEFIKDINVYNTNIDIINKFQKEDINKVYTVNMEFGNRSQIPEIISLGVVAAKEDATILVTNESLTYSQDKFIEKNKVKDIVQVGKEVKDYSFINTITTKSFIVATILIAILLIILIRGWRM